MKYNKDLELLKNKIDSENITAPESLGEDRVMQLIGENEGDRKIIKLENRMSKAAKRAVAVAACFAVVIASLGSVYAYNTRVRQPVAVAEGIVTYKSYKDLANHINNLNKPSISDYSFSFKNYGARYEVEDMAESVKSNSADASTTGESTSSFGETNVQVEGIDEADIVKNDGSYIYYASRDNNSVKIYKIDSGNAEETAVIECDTDVYELFINGDSLILLGSDYASSSDYSNEGTTVKVYDITDRSKPELVNEYSQSGQYTSSRMIGSIVYIISNYYAYDYSYVSNYNSIPKCSCGVDAEAEKLPIEDICEVENNTNTSFAVIGAFDISGNEDSHTTKAMLGVGSEVYCNDKNLYLTCTVFDEVSGSYDYYTPYYNSTRIVKFAFDKTDIELTASAKVPGTVNNQFSLDEKDGNLRIATTSMDSDYSEINNLYVLDEKLEEIGSITGFAKGENIKAVRFLGDMAYVITYVRTDPLFVIDLSNPKKPEITGEVKIDGFSSSLTPVDENTLLGIGYNTYQNQYGGEVTDGIKIVLFDISNKNNPKVLDEKIFDYNSEAQYNHKAIVINRDKGYFAIPVETYYYYDIEAESYIEPDAGDKTGALVIRAENGKLNIEKVERDSDSDTQRVTFAGDYLYMLSAYNITSAEIK